MPGGSGINLSPDISRTKFVEQNFLGVCDMVYQDRKRDMQSWEVPFTSTLNKVFVRGFPSAETYDDLLVGVGDVSSMSSS